MNSAVAKVKIIKTSGVNTNSIAAKIKKTMLSSSAICVGVLGLVSLVFITTNTNSLLKTSMTETVEVASSLVEEEIATMKSITYEIGCNPALAGTVYTNEEKIAILRQK